MTEWAWTKRKKKEELAVLGAETLGKLATPVAIASLTVGAKKGNAAVRQACATALSIAQRQQRGNPAPNPTQ
jgi:ribosomal protein S12